MGHSMKKIISFALAITLMMNIGAISVFAENDEKEAVQSEVALSQDIAQEENLGSSEPYDALNDVSVIVSSQVIRIQEIDGSYYVFLPAHADLQSVIFKAAEGIADFKISGDKGETAANESGTDIPALSAADENGAYTVILSGSNMPQITVKLMKSANIPAMYITSKDAETEGREFVDASKSNSTTGSMCLIDSEGNVTYSDKLKQIKARGNTTFTNAEKKSYQIKLSKKADIINCGESGKTWVLLASYFDATQLRDKMYKDLAKAIGMKYAASCDWIDLYYDGEYRGTYLVSEKNSIGSNTIDITDMEEAYEKVNNDYGDNETFSEAYNKYGQKFTYTENLSEPEDITGGFLLELNNTKIDEVNGFITAQGVAFNVKSPEYCGKAALTYMSEYYQEFENAVYAQDDLGNYTGYNTDTGKYFYDYCNLQSLVRMYLIQRFSNNVDGFYSSFFFYKDAGDIMYAGPVWDMESTSGTGWEGAPPATQEFINARYLAKALSNIPAFMDAVKEYYDSVFRSEALQLVGENGKVMSYAAKLKASSAMNYTMWPLIKLGNPHVSEHFYPDGTTRDDTVADLEKWLNKRVEVLDGNLYGHIHSIVLQNFKEAGCTEDGYTGDKVCSVCNEVVSNGEVVLALGHTEAVDAAVAATCTKTGLTEGKHCSVCDEVLVAQVKTDALGHDYQNGKCSRCEAVDPDYEPQTPVHSHRYAATVTAPTCTEKGYTTYTCACGDSYVDNYVDAKGHTEVVDAAVAATCTKTGLTEGKHCSVCNEVLVKQETVPMSEHKFENGVCTVCGAKDSAVNPFKDVEKSSPYAEAIGWAYANGITKGKTADIFGVNENCTRAQAVTLLWRSAGCPTPTTKSCTFTDVKEGSFCYEAVLWAVENKITLGKTETTFDPNGTATRSQVLTFLYRLAGEPKVENVVNEFEDVNENEFYYNAVLWAVSEGITKGTDAKHFAPSAICSRAQIVTFIFRQSI